MDRNGYTPKPVTLNLTDNALEDAIDRLTKSVLTQNKLAEFNWVLNKVMKDHGHTITLLEAALIAASIPEQYDYKKHCQEIVDQQSADVYNE